MTPVHSTYAPLFARTLLWTLEQHLRKLKISRFATMYSHVLCRKRSIRLLPLLALASLQCITISSSGDEGERVPRSIYRYNYCNTGQLQFWLMAKPAIYTFVSCKTGKLHVRSTVCPFLDFHVEKKNLKNILDTLQEKAHFKTPLNAFLLFPLPS